MELRGKIAVGAGTLAQHNVVNIDVILDGTGGTHADDVFHTVAVVQLMGVDADGGHTPAGSHDGNLHALLGTGVTVDATDIDHQNGVFQEVLGDELAAQGIAGHQHGLAEITGLGGDMGSGGGQHSRFLL